MTRRSTSFAPLLGASLCALTVAIALISLWLRSGLRAQVLQREAATLQAITLWQRELETERLASLGLSPDDREFALIALQVSRLPYMVAGEAFNLAGEPASGPVPGIPAPDAAEWERLRRLEPFARLLGEQEPSLEVTLPLHAPDSDVLTGALRCRMDATALRAELALMDRRLIGQALTVWTCTGLTLALALLLVSRRLDRAERELLARTADLQHANRELTFAAKTSALGAITAHLVHGLRNPVAGLADLEKSPGSAQDSDVTLREASRAARRIRQMVDEVVTLLREERSDPTYEISQREILTLVEREVGDFARDRGVRLTVEAGTDLPLDNRSAALVVAILRNLARNAVEATPRDARVWLRSSTHLGGPVFAVADEGPGLPPGVAARLFEPTTSSKSDGAGIGLAICHQLALHLGAELGPDPSHRPGTCFRLQLPHRPRIAS